MKKLLFILLITLLVSCGTFKPTTTVQSPTFSLSDSAFCVQGGLSASINQDSLLLVAEKGVLLKNGTNWVKFSWESAGTADPLNGNAVIEINACISGSDFCITGKYYVNVHQTAFLTTLGRGITFGSPTANIFVQYSNGKLTVNPKICIKTKKA